MLSALFLNRVSMAAQELAAGRSQTLPSAAPWLFKAPPELYGMAHDMVITGDPAYQGSPCTLWKGEVPSYQTCPASWLVCPFSLVEAVRLLPLHPGSQDRLSYFVWPWWPLVLPCVSSSFSRSRLLRGDLIRSWWCDLVNAIRKFSQDFSCLAGSLAGSQGVHASLHLQLCSGQEEPSASRDQLDTRWKEPRLPPPALLVRLPCLPQPCWSVYLPSLTRVLFGMIEFHQVRTKQTLNNKSQYLGEFSRKWSFLIEVRSLMEHFKGRNLGNVQKFSPLG